MMHIVFCLSNRGNRNYVANFPENGTVFSLRVEIVNVCSIYEHVRNFGNYTQGDETFTATSSRQYESLETL